MKRRGALAVVLMLSALMPLAGCGEATPVVESREALGTAVSITAYGADEAEVRVAIDDAFAAMAGVESALDAYDPASAIAVINADPYTEHQLPPEAIEVVDAVGALDVNREFSLALWPVTRAYGFESSPTVPAAGDLALALAAADGMRLHDDTVLFARVKDPDPRLDAGGMLAPGLDFGGAAKGLALDRAREALRASGAVDAALISAGSTTVTLGTKPDGSVWRIGVEDPRETGAVIAVFQLEGDGAVSTSGDYQRFFEADGVRYHHILNPATGLPVPGLRSLTVGGAGLSGLASDILSTALFVKESGNAAAYAHAAGLGIYLVDAEGRALVVPAPADSGLIVAEEASPKP